MLSPLAFLKKHDVGPTSRFFDDVRRNVRTLDAAEHWTLDELREWQLARAARLIRHASKFVPMYTERFGKEVEITSWDDFRKLAITTRTDYAEVPSPDRFATQFPADSEIADLAPTSGTTGAPIQVARNWLLESWRVACLIREFGLCELDPSQECAIIRTPVDHALEKFDESLGCTRERFWLTSNLGGIIQMAPGYCFDIGLPLSKIGRSIAELKPGIIYSTPTYVETLHEFISEVKITTLLTISEQLFEPTRRRLEKIYDAKVFDSYACVEVNRIAADCPVGGGYHVHDENVIVEILDEQGLPVKPGETGLVVLTSLHNFATPFIRYAPGDLAELGQSDCSCGRHHTKIAVIHGRQVSTLKLPGDRRRVATSLIINLLDLGVASAVQVRQDGFMEFCVLYVPNSPDSDLPLDNVKNWIQQLIEDQAEVKIERVERISPLPNGKTPRCVINF